MQSTNKGDNKLLNMISQSLEQSQSLNWKNLEKKERPGLNLCCPTLRYLIMKKYLCTVENFQ